MVGTASRSSLRRAVFTVSYWLDHRVPMEEIEKVSKELKGSATL
jgi:hypothetical protein